MNLGEKIQLCRKKKGMSQEDLANLLNVSRQAVQKWESGVTVPELNRLLEMSNIFDVTVEWLTKDAEQESKVSEDKNTNSTAENKSLDFGKRSGPSYMSIKVWMIIGIVFTPLSIGGALLEPFNYSYYTLLFLLLYLITVPLGIFILYKVKNAEHKQQVIGLGVITIIFLSLISGILILTMSEDGFSTKNTAKQSVITSKNADLNNAGLNQNQEAKTQFKKGKQKNAAPIIVFTIFGVSILLAAILVPTIAVSMTTNNYTYDYYVEPTAREKAFSKICKDIDLYKVSDDVYQKNIYSLTNNDFNKKLSVDLKDTNKGIYICATGEYWFDTNKDYYVSIYASICIRNSNYQSEFIGNSTYSFLNVQTGTKTYVYLRSDARHLSEYSLSNCLNLYNINLIQNNTKYTSEELKNFMTEETNTLMSTCLTKCNSYLKSFYSISEGLSIFGFKCLN